MRCLPFPGVVLPAWSVQRSSDGRPPARLQGNDIGDDRVMTFSEARDEVSRLVSPLPGDVFVVKGTLLASVPEHPLVFKLQGSSCAEAFIKLMNNSHCRPTG